jgi:dipeptidase E
MIQLFYTMMAMGRGRQLLISNSSQFGRGYLDHVEDEIRWCLGRARRVVFVPFALFDRDGYAAKGSERLRRMGYEADGLRMQSARETVERAEALFVGGGNTFRLLKTLQDLDLVETIRARVGQGMPYIGSSAGSIVAGPSLKTTKDMPIVEPRSFAALGLVEFQISPHFLDPDPTSKHMGETQEERISQFLEENDAPVVGLREGAWLRVDDGVRLGGATGARVFRRGHSPAEAQPGSRIDQLLYGEAR